MKVVDTLYGHPIYTVPTEGEQVKKHRKRRINKKWRKRYGVYHTGFKPGEIIVFKDQFGGESLIMTKETYYKIRKVAK